MHIHIKSYLSRYKKKVQLYLFRRKMVKNDILIDKSCRGYQYVDFQDAIKHGVGVCVLRGCIFSKDVCVGKGTTFGENNFINGPIRIGRYCQLGMSVATLTINHPISYLTTYINKRLFDGELYKNKSKVENGIIIGDGVWIGHNVIILPEVTIGNGAILGAGSVVTKDIPPYAIAVGNPARVIRYRFCEQVQREIEALQWPEMSPEELRKIKPLFFKDYTIKESIYE